MYTPAKVPMEFSNTCMQKSRLNCIDPQDVHVKSLISKSRHGLCSTNPNEKNKQISPLSSSGMHSHPSCNKTPGNRHLSEPPALICSKLIPILSSPPPSNKISGTNRTKEIIKSLHECARAGKAKKAEAYLESMHTLFWAGNKDLEPDVRHFNSVLNAWVKSNEKGKEFRTQEILAWMYKLNDRTDVHYNVKPTRVTFNICINAWCNSKEADAGDRAVNLFDRMILLYEAGDSDLKPDFQSYRLVILALSKKVKRGSAPIAETILQKMRLNGDPHISPDSSLYHMVIHMYSSNRDVNAPQRAEALLNEMHFAFMNGNVSLKPSTITFNTVLNTYAKSIIQGSDEQAEFILQRMQELHKHGYPDIEPDTITFNSVINAHANSRSEESATRAFAVLNKMHVNKNAKPDVRTYNACLKACHYSSYVATEERAAQNFDIACRLLSQIKNQKGLQPDEHTFIWFFRTCQANHYEETRRAQAFQWAFHMCCTQGLCTNRIQQELSEMRMELFPVK